MPLWSCETSSNKPMLAGKHVVVTGAARGIGRAITLAAAANGAVVGLNFRRHAAEATELAGVVAANGWSAPVLLQFDAVDPAAIEQGIARFLESAPRIDGWVNNAAECNPGLLPILSVEEIRRQLDSALLGPVLCSRAVVPHMMEHRCGSIVNIGSTVTRRLTRGQSVYAAAKGGLLSFTRALACEYGRKGIRANLVQPGPVETSMLEAAQAMAGEEILRRIPLGRLCTAEEVAGAVVYLLSDYSSGLTGACLDVDGGYSWS